MSFQMNARGRARLTSTFCFAKLTVQAPADGLVTGGPLGAGGREPGIEPGIEAGMKSGIQKTKGTRGCPASQRRHACRRFGWAGSPITSASLVRLDVSLVAVIRQDDRLASANCLKRFRQAEASVQLEPTAL
jgi:hypothetical protein